MKRRNFLASLFVVPTALKRLAKPAITIRSGESKPNNDLQYAEFKHHFRDYTGTWKFTSYEMEKLPHENLGG